METNPTAMAVSQPFRRKYVAVSRSIGPSNVAMSWGWVLNGPETNKKNTFDAIQIERAGSVILKSTFRTSWRCLNEDISKASKATMAVATGVPNNRTEVKMNVSETEIVAETDGTVIVNRPLIRVNAASSNHVGCGGSTYS